MTDLGKLYTIKLPIVGAQQIDIPVEQLVDDAMRRAASNLRSDAAKLPIDAAVDRATERAVDNLKRRLPLIVIGSLVIVVLGSYLGNRLSR